MTKRKPREPKGKRVTRTGLAEFFGVSLPTVDVWVRDGCPFVKKGSRGVEWEFATGDVWEWHQERAVRDATGDAQLTEQELKRRKLEAETLKAELELEEARGAVALITDFERAQSAFAATVQANIMQVPQRVVLRLLGETDELLFKRVLREELVTALKQAAEDELQIDEDEED